ncbi:Kinesin light chain [Seminavis robusta]|uniref:Kinesin light chain n=1 Tax=Seminavis robusta TaxID=568900 RepID=A0A9N8HJC6_9STRA|nr:Kinesin light chain [Seminavis robusta]|eukprot:Sro544_g163730.1 Kinesin light chain (642) ;mRNA; r:55219-57226
MRQQRALPPAEDTAAPALMPASAGSSSEFDATTITEAENHQHQNAALSIMESSPWWIQELADVDPFENQMPSMFPYHISSGFSDAGLVRRLSGSTMTSNTVSIRSSSSDTTTNTTSPQLRLMQILEQHHMTTWLEQMHTRYLKDARRICRTTRHLANPKEQQGSQQQNNKEDLEDTLCQLETNLSMLQRLSVGGGGMDVQETMATIHGEIAEVALRMHNPERARQALTAQLQSNSTDPVRIAHARTTLGDLENDEGHYDAALQLCQQAQDTYQHWYGQDNIVVGRQWVRRGRTCLNMANTSTCQSNRKKTQQQELAQQALDCLQQGLDILKASSNLGPDASEVGDVLYLMGHAQLAIGSNHAALERLWECLKVCKQQERQQQQQQQQSSPFQPNNDNNKLAKLEVLKTLRAIAMVHHRNGAEELATRCYDDCERLGKEIKDADGQAELARTWLFRGHLHTRICQKDQRECARGMYQDALSVAVSLQDLTLLGETLVAMGDYCCLVGEEEQAMSYYQQVPSACQQYRYVSLIRGILHLRRAETTSAIACLEEFTLLQGAEDETCMVATLSMGVCHAAEGDKDQAKRRYKEALALYSTGHLFSNDPTSKEILQRFKARVSKRGSIGKVFGRIKKAVRMNSIEE